jgi:C-terminal processing protease CtpA/Prc
VRKGLADQVALAYESLLQTNKLKGLVLDLRFAGGQEYEAAAKVADRFLTKEVALLDWQEGSAHSAAKSEAIKLPVVVLVNRQTTAAAEALAAVMRETDVAVLIGAPTAGAAHLFKEFALSDGRKLRIASGSVQLGDGKKLSSEGVTPDIQVTVAGDDEALVFADPYSQIARSQSASAAPTQTSSSARQPRRRINEAELVRLQREGLDAGEPATPVTRPPADDNAEPVVRDPALARALDLLKGISVLGQARPR